MAERSGTPDDRAVFVISVAAELAGVHPQTLRIPPGTQNGRTFRVRGRGVPGAARRLTGDLLVTVEVAVPEKLSRKERELLREFASLSDTSPRDHLGMER